jgi:hypothetical protein
MAGRDGDLYTSRGCIWRSVDGADFASASRFVALALPLLPGPSHGLSTLQQSVATPFREPLQFIVIAVMSVIPLYLWGFCMTVH